MKRAGGLRSVGVGVALANKGLATTHSFVSTVIDVAMVLPSLVNLDASICPIGGTHTGATKPPESNAARSLTHIKDAILAVLARYTEWQRPASNAPPSNAWHEVPLPEDAWTVVMQHLPQESTRQLALVNVEGQELMQGILAAEHSELRQLATQSGMITQRGQTTHTNVDVPVPWDPRGHPIEPALQFLHRGGAGRVAANQVYIQVDKRGLAAFWGSMYTWPHAEARVCCWSNAVTSLIIAATQLGVQSHTTASHYTPTYGSALRNIINKARHVGVSVHLEEKDTFFTSAVLRGMYVEYAMWHAIGHSQLHEAAFRMKYAEETSTATELGKHALSNLLDKTPAYEEALTPAIIEQVRKSVNIAIRPTSSLNYEEDELVEAILQATGDAGEHRAMLKSLLMHVKLDTLLMSPLPALLPAWNAVEVEIVNCIRAHTDAANGYYDDLHLLLKWPK